MAILNMIYGKGGSPVQVPLDAISDLLVVGGNAEATITWSDPGNIIVNGVLVTSRTATKLVRKVGSAPVDSSDGTLVLTETVANTYSSNGYVDTGLTNGTTYYYGAFAVGDNGLETISNITYVTPSTGWIPGANTIAFRPINSTTTSYDQNPSQTKYNLVAHDMTYDSISAIFPSGNTGGTFFEQTTIPGVCSTTGNKFYVGGWVKQNGNNGARMMAPLNNRGTYISFDGSHVIGGEPGTNGASCTVTLNSSLQGQRVYVFYTGQVGSTVTVGCIYNGVEQNTTGTGKTINITGIVLGTNGHSSYRYADSLSGNMSNRVIENREWSAQDRMNFYDITKADYGY